MAKKRIRLEQAEGLMALGTAREARQEEEENGRRRPEKEPRRHPRKKPDEVQVSAYIHRDLHRRLRVALGGRRDELHRPCHLSS
jgi:hypothetical protein